MSRILVAMLSTALIALGGCGVAPERTADAAPTQTEATPTTQPPSQVPATPAPLPTPPRPTTVTVPVGTVMEVALLDGLSSGTSQQGDPFTAEVLEPVFIDGIEVIPFGSTVHGMVSDVKKAKRGAGNASLGLEFTAIDLPGGFSTDLTASLSEQSESMKKRNATVIGGSAAGGALLGRILGKDTKGAVIGSIVGGAIGTGVIMAKEGEQVELPTGTGLTVQLEDSIEVPRS